MRQLVPFSIASLEGGLVSSTPSTDIRDNQFADGRNIFLDENSKPTRRPGMASTGVDESNAIRMLHRYNVSGGTDYQVYVEGTNLKRRTTSTGTTVYSSLTSDLRTRGAVMYKTLYLCNGTDVPISWDQSSVATVTGMPKGTDCFEFRERLFTYGMTDETTETDLPYFLRYSKAKNATDWSTGTNFINIGESDGYIIRKCLVDKQRIIVFKDSRGGVYTVTFDSLGEYDKEKILEIGTCAADSVVMAANDIYFLTLAGSVPSFVSLGEEMNYQGTDRAGIGISAPVRDKFEAINTAYIQNSQAFFYNDKIYLAVPTGTSTVNNIIYIYDLVRKIWLAPIEGECTEGGVTVFSTYLEGTRERLYWGDAAGKIWKEGDAYSDDGEAIDSWVLTKQYPMQWSNREAKERMKTWYEVMALLSEATIGVSMTVYIDGIEKFTVNFNPINVASLSSTYGRMTYGDGYERVGGVDYYNEIGTGLESEVTKYFTRLLKRMNQRGYTIQFKFRSNGTNSLFTLKGFTITKSVIHETGFQAPSLIS